MQTSNKIAMVMTLDRENYIYSPHSLWTTRALALNAAREFGGSEWLIVEFSLDNVAPKNCVWSFHADCGDAVERELYSQHWPDGSIPDFPF